MNYQNYLLKREKDITIELKQIPFEGYRNLPNDLISFMNNYDIKKHYTISKGFLMSFLGNTFNGEFVRINEFYEVNEFLFLPQRRSKMLCIADNNQPNGGLNISLEPDTYGQVFSYRQGPGLDEPYDEYEIYVKVANSFTEFLDNLRVFAEVVDGFRSVYQEIDFDGSKIIYLPNIIK
jgi:hypothetical protein